MQSHTVKVDIQMNINIMFNVVLEISENSRNIVGNFAYIL